MRKLISVVLLVVLVLGIAVGAEILTPETHKRIYHHEIAANAQYCENVAPGEFCTHLPLVTVDTRGGELSSTEEILTDLQIVDHEGGHNHLGDKSKVHVSSLMKIRGNSSLLFDKKQYRLTFVDDKDFERATDDPQLLPRVEKKVMGMPKESEWILNGPFLDFTLMRNYLMYNLAGEIMDWAPNVRYCELFLNGEYQGIYLMVEAIKMDEARVDMPRLNPQRLGTSYLLNRDRDGDTGCQLSTFGEYSGWTFNELGVKYPGIRSGRTDAHIEYVRQDVGAIEKLLYSLDYDDPVFGYKSVLDVQSFVDYYILLEFSLNVDAGALSTYAYKPLGGKLTMGPVWDFNNCYNNYQDYIHDIQDFYGVDKPWYEMLMKDEEFVEEVISRYYLLRKGPLAEERIYKIMDDTIEFLGPALKRNNERWDYAYHDHMLAYVDILGNALPYDRNPETYEEAVALLKRVIHERGEFLDEHIGALRQFCAESKVKEWN